MPALLRRRLQRARAEQEHWYEAYEILHRESPVLRIRGEGIGPDSDAFILTRHEDITRVVKDPARFTPMITLAVDGVLLIAEHGDDPANEKGQKLYPRYELFEQILSVFRNSGRTVPVFNNKHLSWNWD